MNQPEPHVAETHKLSLSAVAHLKTTAPVIVYAAALLLVLQLVATLVAPVLVPDHIFLSLYLSEKAQANQHRFARGDDPYLVWDDVTGWGGRPGSQRELWKLNSKGARVSSDHGLIPNKKRSVCFIGNSLTNGGMHVSNDATISAFLEDSTTETANYGTMLFSADQMCLQYEHYIRPDSPDVLIIGLTGKPLNGLGNRYVPFWRRQEVNIPFFKPRTMSHRGVLETLPPFPPGTYDAMITNSHDVFEELEGTDRNYGDFESYKRFGLMPISAELWAGARRLDNLIRRFRPVNGLETELLPILHFLQNLTSADGTRLVVMVLPTLNETFPPAWQRWTHDHVAQLIGTLQDAEFQVLDVREVLRRSELPPDSLYVADRVHYTAVANRLVADRLGEMLNRSY